MPPIVPLCLGFLAGLWLGGGMPAGAPAVAAIGLLLLVGGAMFRRGARFAAGNGLLFAGAFLLASARIQGGAAAIPENDISVWNDSGKVTLEVRVADEPELRGSYRRFPANVRSVLDEEGEHEATGTVQVDTSFDADVHAGDVVLLAGIPQTPPSFATFDYREYLDRQGIRSTMRFPAVETSGKESGFDPGIALIRLRVWTVQTLERALPDPAAGVAVGLLVGGRSTLAQSTIDDFARTGTSHLLAVSGFNVSVVTGAAIFVLIPLLGRRRAIPLAMALIVAFTILAGATPSALRAAVMAAIALLGIMLGRQRHSHFLLLLAVAAQCAIDPGLLRDVGFQLSVAATAGIVLLTPRLIEAADRVPFIVDHLAPRAAFAVLAATFSAFVTTLPIIASTFHSVSLAAIPANLLITPFVSPAMAGSFVLVILGAVSAELSRLAAPVALLFLQPMLALASLLARLPLASVRVGEISPTAIGLFYLALALPIAGNRYLTSLTAGIRRLPWGAFRLPAATAAACLVWAGVFEPGSDSTRITVFDLGGEQSALIRSAAGRTVLIGSAKSPGKLLEALGGELPAVERKIDVLVLPGWQDDFVAGAEDLLKRYEVETVFAPPAGQFTGGGRLRAALGDRRLNYQTVSTEKAVKLGDGSELLLVPDTPPEAGLAVVFREAGFSAAWSGAIASPNGLASRIGPVTALFTPAADARWTTLLNPAVVLSSPRPGLTLQDGGGASLYRTDRDGTIRLDVSRNGKIRVLLAEHGK